MRARTPFAHLRTKAKTPGVVADLGELGFGESEPFTRQLEFTFERAGKNTRVIRIEGERYAGVEEAADGVPGQIGDGAGFDVARDADFEGNAFFLETAEQVGVIDGADTVTDAFGAQVEGCPDGGRAVGFARVGSEPESCVFCVLVGRAESGGRSANLIAADSEGDDAVADILSREAGDGENVVGPELADRVEVPENFHGVVRRNRLLGFLLGLANSAPDGIEIEAAPLHDTSAQGDFGVPDALLRERFDHAAGDERVIFRTAEALRDKLKAFEKAAETAESPHFIDEFAGERGVEHPDRIAVHGAFQMEV